MGFGTFLAVIEFGVCSQWFKDSQKQDWEIERILILK